MTHLKQSSLTALLTRQDGSSPAARVPSRVRDQAHDALWEGRRATKKANEKVERAKKTAVKAVARAVVRSKEEQSVNREILRRGWAKAPSVLSQDSLEAFDEALLAPPPYHGNTERGGNDVIKEAATARGGSARFDRETLTWYVEDRRTMLAVMRTGAWNPLVLDVKSRQLEAARTHMASQLERLLAPRHGGAAEVEVADVGGDPVPVRPRPSDVPPDVEEDFCRMEAMGLPRGAVTLLTELPDSLLGPHTGISSTGRVVRALVLGPLLPSHVEMYYARYLDGAITSNEFLRLASGL